MTTPRAFLSLLSIVLCLAVLPAAAQAEPDAVIPVVGSTAGASGANFRTEAQLHNPTGETMRGKLVFVWQGIPIQPNPPAELDYELAPRRTVLYEDLVAAMGGNGLGSIDVFAEQGGVPRILVRAFDDKGEKGTTGLTVPVLSVEQALVTGRKIALVVPSDLVRYRFNVGVRTLPSEDDNVTLRIVVHGADGAQLGDEVIREFPESFFAQTPGELFLGRPLDAGSSLLVEVLSGRVILYSTTTDNTTNDGSIQIDRVLNLPPTVEPTDPQVTTAQSTPVTVPFLVTDPDGDTVTVSLGAAPAHGAVEIALAEAGVSYRVTYTPDSGFEGDDAFTLAFDDGNGGLTVVTVSVGVTGGNAAPFALGNSYSMIEGETLTVAAPGVLSNDSDPDGDTLTAVLESGPSHASSFTLNADGSLSYVPNPVFTGTDLFTYRASDGQTTSSVATVSIRVASANTAPSAAPDAATTDEDTPVVIDVVANDSDAETPGQVTLVGVITGGTLGTVSVVGNQVSYDPTTSPTLQALASGSSAIDTFQYTIRDPLGLTATTTVTVTVSGIDDLPTATNDSATLLEDASATAIPVLANDVDPDGGAITIGSVTQGTIGTVVITGGGSGLTYQPNADACGADSFTYTLNGGSVGTVNVTVTCVNDAPSFTKGLDQTVLEDAGAQTVNGWATGLSAGPANESAQTLSFVIDTNTNAALFSAGPAVDAAGNLTYTPAANAFGTATITLHVEDDGGTTDGGVDASATQSFVITVTSVNDNPTANDDAATVAEDSGANAIDVLANDDDAPETGEILTINGVTQGASGTVVITGGGTGVTYQPLPNFAGVDTFTYTISDGNGGTATGTVTVTVTAVNDAPVNSVPGAQTVDQLLTLTFSTANSNLISISDVDAVTPRVEIGVMIGTLTLSGTTGLTFSSGDGTADSTMTFSGTIAAINAALDGLVYDPVDTSSGAVTLVITTYDLGQTGTGGALADTDSVTINVTAINDPPVNSLPAAQAVGEDTTLTLSTGNANLISISDPDAGSATVQVALTATNGTLTLSGTAGLSFVFTDVNGTGTGDGTADATMTFRGTIAAINTALDGLQFVPTTAFSGAASLEIVTNDLGNTGTGGVQSDTDTLSITVSAVNDAPVNTVPATQNVNEDTALTFSVGNGNLISVADDDAGASDVEITLGVTNGTLTLSGLTGLVFTTGDGTADASMVFTGTLTNVNSALAGMFYTPSADFNGSSTLTITTNDQGNTGSGGALSDTDNVSITVTAVNDPPSFTKGSNQSVAEDSGAQSVAGWATAISAGPADESGQTLTFNITGNTNSGLFAAGPAISSTGTLTYTPAANAFGTATITVTLSDNGGGTDTSASQSFDITVTAVNDPPSFTTGGNVSSDEDAGAQTVNPWATAISQGPGESGQTLTFNITGNTNTTLFSAGPAISSTGVLTYTSALNAFGTATITVTLSDDGGGTDTSGAVMFTITVNSVNDPPVADDETFDTIGNTELRVDLAAGTTPNVAASTTDTNSVPNDGVLDGDSDPVEGSAISIVACSGDVSAPFNCTTANGGSVALNADGTFSYVPAAGDTAASDSFTYTISDGADTDIGTVTINRSERVWYVDPNAAGGGNGTSAQPFNSLDSLDGVGGAGDSDIAGDYIFVHDGSLSLAAPIELEANQHLLGEGAGLSIPVSLNGNASPWVGLAAGTRPQLTNAAGDAVTVTAAMPIEIMGLSLQGSGNAIDLTTSGALSGSATLTIGNNEFRGAGAEGFDANLNATGTLTLNVVGNSWNLAGTHTGNAIDVNRTAGTLNLNLTNNTNIVSSAGGINVVGALANTFIVGFASNTVHQNTGGTGISISNATFDATPGGAFQQVTGGTTTIGTSGDGVGASGMILTNVAGDLAFTDLDVFASNGSGVVITGIAAVNTGAGTGTRVTVGAGVGVVQATNGPAVNLSGMTADFQLSSLTSTNSTSTGVSLSNVVDGTTASTFSAGAGSSITNATGTDFAVSGGNATITYNGTITDDVGQLVSVANATGDTISFTGAITDGNDGDGSGISLTNNVGATINFSGGLTLSTGTAAAFTATGGGTVNVTGTNTLTTTTGTALNVANTTIGASGLTFRSITAGTGASGPTNGILLNNTGSTGGLTVTGTGAAGSGGTIQRTTGPGISLTSAANVSLSFMNVQNGTDDGINASSVAGLALASMSVTNNGDSPTDEGIQLANVSGVVTISNSTVTGNAHNNLWLDNNNALPLTSFTVTGGSFSSNSAGNGNHGILFEARGTSQVTAATINGVTISNNKVLGVQVATADTATVSNFTVQNSTFSDTGTGNSQEIGVDCSKAQLSNLRCTVSNNTFNGHNSHAMNFFTAAGAGTGGAFNATISSNVIGTAAVASSGSVIGNGIRVNLNGDSDNNVLLSGNTIRQTPNGRGIEVISRNGTGGSDVTVTNNDVNPQDTSGFPLAAIFMQSNCATVCNTLRSDVRTNTVPAGATFDLLPTYIALVETSTSVLQLVDTAPASASCTDQLTSTNTGSASASAGCALIAGPIATP